MNFNIINSGNTLIFEEFLNLSSIVSSQSDCSGIIIILILNDDTSCTIELLFSACGVPSSRISISYSNRILQESQPRLSMFSYYFSSSSEYLVRMHAIRITKSNLAMSSKLS